MLTGFVLVAGCLALLAAGHVLEKRAARDWRASLSETADHLGIEFHRQFLPLLGSSFALGEPREGMKLKIERGRRNEKGHAGTPWMWRVALWGPIPRSLTIRKEDSYSKMAQKLFRADRQAGLDLFDEVFLIKGLPELETLALLSNRTRQALWKGLDHDFRIDNGFLKVSAYMRGNTWFWDSTGAYPELVATLNDRAEEIIELAEALAERSGPPAPHLLHHAFEDPERAFRLRCFEALTRQLPDTPEAHE
ncbi:MAG: hypothetical protein VX498_10550, partial [Myxococcota bacterium]|nr:hypothetical protein [Myxococcota bacterium]